jgi:hypothetical protein
VPRLQCRVNGGHWGSLRWIRDASRGARSVSPQTCWAGRSRDLCQCEGAGSGWSQVHKSVGVLLFETDAGAAFHWAPWRMQVTLPLSAPTRPLAAAAMR